MFLVFCGDTYYPRGGGDDYKHCFLTKEEAEAYCVGYCVDGSCRWAHVLNVESKEVVIRCSGN
jgi:hypothetical protein